jgi:cell division protein FtsI/penicillin-binding protein 2
MNPVHDSKDWRNNNGFNSQAPLQTPPIAIATAAADQSSSPKLGQANNSGYSSPVMEYQAQNGSVYQQQQPNL